MEIQHADWEMDAILAEEMLVRNYMTRTEMQNMVLEQNRQNQRAQKRWGKLSEAKRLEHKKAQRKVYAARDEWLKCYKALKQQYLATTHSFIPELRFDSTKRSFIGLAKWQQTVKGADGANVTVTNQQEFVLQDKFVEEHFQDDVLQYVKKAATSGAHGTKFLAVPQPIGLELDTRVVTHVKFARSAHFPEGRYKVRYSDKTEEAMATNVLIQLFGEKFLSIVKHYSHKGFVVIPPGDSVKRSFEAPVQTPRSQQIVVHFKQNEHNTCVFSSFASALWAIGFPEIGICVAKEVKTTIDNPSVLARLAVLMGENFWLQPCKIKRPNEFPLLTVDLSEALVVVVLKASDGSAHHAVTVHDGLIFDSNEQTSLPLCQANLDFLCSTDARRATYEGIATGYIYQEQGKKQRIISQKSKIEGDPWSMFCKPTAM